MGGVMRETLAPVGDIETTCECRNGGPDRRHGYAPGMATILHIAYPDQWEAALEAGCYRWSTRGKSLDDGATFIHASRPEQVAMVANFAYDDVDQPLCLLVIDTERLVSALCDEDLDGIGISFPHIYGPLNLDAVVSVRPYERAADGRWPEVSAQAVS